MSRCVVDTNVPIVANGGAASDARRPSVSCRNEAIRFLMKLLESGTVLLDLEGEMQAEYHRHLNPRGQPGVGDRFYLTVLNSSPKLVERISVPKREDGQFADLPQSLIDENFDPSDRKFVAMARRENVPVFNATDSDWINHAQTLIAEGIEVVHICGCKTEEWFEA
ncbi:hypothetical protein M1D80_08265 [Phyllobacteriaceae bacterium JZ32]